MLKPKLFLSLHWFSNQAPWISCDKVSWVSPAGALCGSKSRATIIPCTKQNTSTSNVPHNSGLLPKIHFKERVPLITERKMSGNNCDYTLLVMGWAEPPLDRWNLNQTLKDKAELESLPSLSTQIQILHGSMQRTSSQEPYHSSYRKL